MQDIIRDESVSVEGQTSASLNAVNLATLGPNPGFEAVRAVAGPMGRSVADLERAARVLFGERGSGNGSLCRSRIAT